MRKSNNQLTSIELLFANKDIIAIHKDPGIPCQSRNREHPLPLDLSLQKLLNEPVQIWTRIDQPVSGIVLFHRNSNGSSTDQYSILSKTYLGIVEGHPSEKQQTLISHLRRDGRNRRSVTDVDKGKRSELSYTVLKEFEKYSLLKIVPVTGRFHQIRKQLSEIGHPVKGDIKYGARRKNPDRSIHLHSLEYRIESKGDVHTILDTSFPDESLWNLTKAHLYNGIMNSPSVNLRKRMTNTSDK